MVLTDRRWTGDCLFGPDPWPPTVRGVGMERALFRMLAATTAAASPHRLRFDYHRRRTERRAANARRVRAALGGSGYRRPAQGHEDRSSTDRRPRKGLGARLNPQLRTPRRRAWLLCKRSKGQLVADGSQRGEGRSASSRAKRISRRSSKRPSPCTQPSTVPRNTSSSRLDACSRLPFAKEMRRLNIGSDDRQGAE
jgi:hypothetical protein